MNKKFLSLSLLSILALVGCNNSNELTSNSANISNITSSTSSSSSSTSSSENTVNVEEVISILNNYAKAESYTVDSLESDGNDGTIQLQDIYTKDYISIGYAKGGYVTLPSVDTAKYGPSMVYSFKYDTDNQVHLGKAVSYYDDNDNLSSVKSCKDLDYLKLFNNSNYALKASDFKKASNRIYSTADNVLYVLSHLMGYDSTNTDYNIVEADFYVENGVLTFELYKQIETDYNSTEVLITATLNKLNQTSSQVLADFIASYKTPTNKMSDDVRQKLTAENVGFNTDISYKNSYGQFQSFGSTKVVSHFDSKNRANDLVSYDFTDTINNESYSYVLKRDTDLKGALDTYIDGNNNVKTEKFDHSDFYFGNGIFFLQEEIDLDSFVSNTDNDFSYLGINYDRIYESIAALTVLTDLNIKDIVRMTVTTNENGLVITADLDAFYYGEDGSAIDLILKTTSTLITDPIVSLPLEGYKEDEDSKALDTDIKNTFSQSFVADGHGLTSSGAIAETLPSNTYYYQKDQYLIFREKNRGNYVETIYGYKKMDNGLLKFTVDKKGNVTASGNIIADKTLSDFIPWTAKSVVFNKIDEKTYALKPYVKHVDKTIFGGSSVHGLVGSTFRINIDDNNRIDNVSYQYVTSGLLTGKEELKFSYKNEIEFPSSIVNKDGFDTLTEGTSAIYNWTQEKDTNIGKMFTKKYGDKASSIPYLYDANISGKWFLGTNYDSTGDFCIYNSQDITSYVTNYKELLVEQGYVETKVTISSIEYTYYIKDNVRIRFGEKGEYDFSKYIYFGIAN